MGCSIANGSVGHEWMLLDIGLTAQKGVAGRPLDRIMTKEGAEEFGKQWKRERKESKED